MLGGHALHTLDQRGAGAAPLGGRVEGEDLALVAVDHIGEDPGQLAVELGDQFGVLQRLLQPAEAGHAGRVALGKEGGNRRTVGFLTGANVQPRYPNSARSTIVVASTEGGSVP